MAAPRLLFVTAVAFPIALFAQEPQHHGTPEQLGRAEFAISCRGEAQARFDRALVLLHSFWWDEAEVAFGEVAEADPKCGMAHWGLALTRWDNPFAAGPAGERLAAGAAAAARAASLSAATSRERDYIAAVSALYRDHATTSNPARLGAYSEAMAETYRRNPADPEAAIFYAISLVATASPTDTTFARQRQANGILNPLFAERPDHPGLAHYIIHANDSPRLASYGLQAARRYLEIAPSVPHAQHMPSHIFVRLGLWDEAIASNRGSYDAGAQYAEAQGREGLGAHEFHAMDYMVYGYLQTGRDSAATAWTGHALGVTKVVPAGQIVSEYARAAMPARLALERERWNEAAQLDTIASGPVPKAVTHFARGIGAVRSGAFDAARAAVDALAAIEQQLADAPGYDWSRVIGIKRRAVGAWIELAEGDTAGALAQALEAAQLEEVTEKHPVTPGEVLPARELYADMLLAVGRYDEARASYELTLERERGRARSVFGVARAAELAGDRARARVGYGRYLELMKASDGDRPELAVARRGAGG
jgi:hypothetical protein